MQGAGEVPSQEARPPHEAAIGTAARGGAPASLSRCERVARRVRRDGGGGGGGGGGVARALRPAIYIYELPIEFNVQLWTTKSKDEDCTLRSYAESRSPRSYLRDPISEELTRRQYTPGHSGVVCLSARLTDDGGHFSSFAQVQTGQLN